MMEKNWLIRTHNFKILGPVSKDKIFELIEKKSLHEEDELCPGNGHWFFIREKDLLDQYLYGDIPSTFNPVSEAPKHISNKSPTEMASFLADIEIGLIKSKAPQPSRDVTLVANLNDFKDQLNAANDDDAPPVEKLPDEDDLAYPDMGEMLQASSTQAPAPSMSVSEGKKSTAPTPVVDEDEALPLETKLPDASDLDYPDMGEPETPPKPEIIPEKKIPEPDLNLMSPSELEIETPVQAPPPIEPAKPLVKKSGPSIKMANMKVTEKAEIDPMVLMQIAAAGEGKKSSATPRRNDHFLVIVFLLILAVIGVLFYQYKQMVKKTVTAKHAIINKNIQKVDARPAPAPVTDEEPPAPLLPQEEATSDANP